LCSQVEEPKKGVVDWSECFDECWGVNAADDREANADDLWTALWTGAVVAVGAVVVAVVVKMPEMEMLEDWKTTRKDGQKIAKQGERRESVWEMGKMVLCMYVIHLAPESADLAVSFPFALFSPYILYKEELADPEEDQDRTMG